MKNLTIITIILAAILLVAYVFYEKGRNFSLDKDAEMIKGCLSQEYSSLTYYEVGKGVYADFSCTDLAKINRSYPPWPDGNLIIGQATTSPGLLK